MRDPTPDPWGLPGLDHVAGRLTAALIARDGADPQAAVALFWQVRRELAKGDPARRPEFAC